MCPHPTVNARRLLTSAILVLVIPFVCEARSARDFVAAYAPLRPVVKPQQIRISAHAPTGQVIVKFRRGANLSTSENRLGGTLGDRVQSIAAGSGLRPLTPLIHEDPVVIQTRRLRAEDRALMNLPDMSLYYHTPAADHLTAMTVINALNDLPEVEIAYFYPKPENAEWTGTATVPNYEQGQYYLDEAPGGVDSRAAWSLPGGHGEGVTVIDVENGWNLDHEDFSSGQTAVIVGGGSVASDDHGTAVLGEMFADRNLQGMTGMVTEATPGVSPVDTTVAGAIVEAAAYLGPGDIILIEQHAPGPRFNYEWLPDQKGYVPMEFFQADFDAMLNAYASGIIVCEAAGNGEEDLDDVLYAPLFDTTFRNSHAIMCGAGNPPVGGVAQDRSKLDFSNYGERVNLQGYGRAVYTLGYGDLYNGGSEDSWYTNSFSGTSSASPIVTGAVAALSGIFQNMFGTIIDADSVLALLVPTGSPQQSPNLIWHIGPRPDLRAAIAPLFDPIDSMWYGDIGLCKSGTSAMPIYLTNSHPVREIYLPFKWSGGATIFIDSLTRAVRTKDFAGIHLTLDNRYNGEIAFVLRSDNGGPEPPLGAGSGAVAYLWVRTNPAAQLGQSTIVDSAWLGSTNRLRLTSAFDDGYPDYFSAGSITIATECEFPVFCGASCPHQGDVDANGSLDAVDLNYLISTLFFGYPEIQDPGCDVARTDYNADGFSDSSDLFLIIQRIFFNGSPPLNPCD